MRWLVLLGIAVVFAGFMLASRSGPHEAGEVSVERDEGGVEPDAAAVRLQRHPKAGEHEEGEVVQAQVKVDLEGLRARLKSGDVEDLLRALKEVEVLGADASDFVDDVIALLPHENSRILDATRVALGSLGPAMVEPLLAAVLKAHSEHGEAVRIDARWIFEASLILRKAKQSAWLPVADLIGHETAGLWARETLLELSQSEVDTEPAVDLLIRKLRSPAQEDPLIETILAVPALKTHAVRAVPAVTELLGDERELVRLYAALVLGRIGPDASSALTELEYLRHSADPEDDLLLKVLDDAIARIRGDD